MTNDKKGIRFFICHLSFVIFAFLLRLVSLGRYVTPDEPMWAYRSVRFADALVARDWASIPATGHPGVTTMWLGALGVGLRRVLTPVESGVHLDWIRSLVWVAPENPEAFRHLVFFLPFGRVAVALVTTLGLIIAYALLLRLFGRSAAVVGVGLLALEPFLIGHSGLLHTDALLSTFCLLALLAALNGLRGQRPVRWWALAGLFTGLALLTKTPALILPPFLLLLLLCSRASRRSCSSAPLRPHGLKFAICSYFAFSLAAFLVYAALYPAVWSDPLAVWRTLTGFATQHVASALRPVFFLGENTFDPGAAFYPLVFLFRASPVVLLGLVLGLITMFRMPPERRLAFGAFLIFALLFGVAISQGAKKHDRYLLPIFPPLAVAASLALTGRSKERAGRSLWQRFRPFAPVAFQFLILLPFITSPLIYYNPVAGGPWVARHVLPLGWGEQVGDAARWLNRLPDADQLTVAAAYAPSFAGLFSGHTILSDQAELADYVVRLIPQGAQPESSLAYYHPVYTATIGFVDQAVVVANTAPAVQSAYLADRAAAGDLVVIDADIPLLRQYDGPGTVVSVASLADEAAVADALMAQLPASDAIWLVSSPAASPVTAAHVERQLGALAEPEETATVAGAAVTRFSARAEPRTVDALPYRAVFAGQLALVDGAIPRTTAPDVLRFVLRWHALTPPTTDYRVLITLRDGAGRIWSSVERPVLNGVDFPTSAWEPGGWADRAYVLSLPAGIPPDDYAVEVALYDPTTGAGQGATGPDGAFRGTRVPVGWVSVLPPETAPPFDAASMTPLDLAAGPLTLLAFDPPPAEALSGDRLGFSLFWRADAPPQTDYSVRLQLVDAQGEVAASSIAALSSYPTSRWHAGEWFESRYRLHVPPTLASGDYQLTIGVFDSGGTPLWDDDRTLAEIAVHARERTFALPVSIAHPLDIAFGDLVTLRGYELMSSEVAAGESLPLTLIWQVEGPAQRELTLFVHLLGPDGRSFGQVDRAPGGGAAPATSWAPGQVLVEEVALPIAAGAPPGTYHLAVGFYDPAYGDRLVPFGEDGAPLSGEHFILPVDIVVGGDQQ